MMPPTQNLSRDEEVVTSNKLVMRENGNYIINTDNIHEFISTDTRNLSFPRVSATAYAYCIWYLISTFYHRFTFLYML